MKNIILMAGLILTGCGYANLDEVKSIADEKWKKQGFEVVDYAGFEWGVWLGGNYGGANVWYRLKKLPDNGITYSGYLKKWGNEIHVYGPKAHDAIGP